MTGLSQKNAVMLFAGPLLALVLYTLLHAGIGHLAALTAGITAWCISVSYTHLTLPTSSRV